MTTLGQIRSHSESLNQQISNLEADSYSNDPTQQSEMAVLGKVNAANLIQLHSQQDTNQLLAPGIPQKNGGHRQNISAPQRPHTPPLAILIHLPSPHPTLHTA